MGKNFFVLPVKDEEEAYETGNLIDFACFIENYKLIALNLRKQTKLKDPQRINFIGKLGNQIHRATMFSIIKKSEETTFSFLQNLVTII